MSSDGYLPIKVIFPQAGDYKAPTAGGGSKTVFGEVTAEIRKDLASQVRNIEKAIASVPNRPPGIPAVAKVRLKKEAIAKSHRPSELFNATTCPIIGGSSLGELYVSVDPVGLEKLAGRIETGHTKTIEANISTLQAIEPYAISDVLGSATLEQLAEDLIVRGASLRVRLFRYGSRDRDQSIDAAFETAIRRMGIGDLERLDYAEGIRIYRASHVDSEGLVALANTVGIQSLSVFPSYRIIRTASSAIGSVTTKDFPPPEPNVDYPVLGIIDSGTDPNNSHLQAWVHDRVEYVPADRQDNEHGSFVAGLAIHGRLLNHNDSRFPSASCRIVDIVALDNVDGIGEAELLDVIDDAITRYPDVKVWNLSLGSDTPCTDELFSELGAALDERMARHGVVFIVAAGNYAAAPFRGWPAESGIDESDRIGAPADATRVITVGSVAHRDTASTRVRVGEPSPFSRRGPGPAYVIKPELSFFGGNCDSTGQCIQSGVISLDGSGQKAENIGTSFATPLVASIAANVEAEVRAGEASARPGLVKALMVHAAFIKNSPLDGALVNYTGLGCPPDVSEILQCTQSAATIILQVPVQPAPVFGKRPFPIPPCLIDPQKGLRGEIFMTLLYEPPVDRGFGVEYCRSNVTASLGIISESQPGQVSRQVDPVPKHLNTAYEEDLIKQGYKWSPLKLYHSRFTGGRRGRRWNLQLKMLNRFDHDPQDNQDVILIITVKGLEDGLPVYDEMIREMNRLGWNAVDLPLRSRLRT